jgi:hypothetical protein
MYRPRNLGFLGQLPEFNPYANPVPGQPYIFNFSVTVTTGNAASDQAAIQSALQSYPLFSNGALSLIGVTVVSGAASISALANATAASVTLGGIESDMANFVNNAGSGVAISPADFAGGGTTTSASQFQQAGGLIVNPLPGIQAGASAVGTAIAQTGAQVLALTPVGIASAFKTGSLPGTGTPSIYAPPAPPPTPPTPTSTLPEWVWWVLAGVGALVILDVVS